MHRCFSIDEIIRLVACEIIESENGATAVSLACCCKGFEGPVLDVLWTTQDKLVPLLKCLPQDSWEESDENFVSRLYNGIPVQCT